MSATSIAEAEPDVQSAVVARQNDAFRAALLSNGGSGFPGKTVCTQGIAAEGPLFMAELLHAVATFDAFNEDNDPYGDHTGSVTSQTCLLTRTCRSSKAAGRKNT